MKIGFYTHIAQRCEDRGNTRAAATWLRVALCHATRRDRRVILRWLDRHEMQQRNALRRFKVEMAEVAAMVEMDIAA